MAGRAQGGERGEKRGNDANNVDDDDEGDDDEGDDDDDEESLPEVKCRRHGPTILHSLGAAAGFGPHQIVYQAAGAPRGSPRKRRRRRGDRGRPRSHGGGGGGFDEEEEAAPPLPLWKGPQKRGGADDLGGTGAGKGVGATTTTTTAAAAAAAAAAVNRRRPPAAAEPRRAKHDSAGGGATSWTYTRSYKEEDDLIGEDTAEEGVGILSRLPIVAVAAVPIPSSLQ